MKPAVTKIFTRNSDFQIIETLRRNRVKRSQTGEFFVEGVRSIEQAVRNGWAIKAFVYSRDRRLSDWAEGILSRSSAARHFELPAALMEDLSEKEEPSELIAIAAMPPDDLARIPVRDNPLVIVLDRPILPGNIGTIIRSCDALRADGLVITGHAADLYDPETIRATTGSFFCVPTVRLPSYKDLIPWIELLKQHHPRLQVVGTSAKSSVLIQDFDFTAPIVLIAGNETHGLSQNTRALCDAMVTIPMYGTASSFNLSNAVSIMLYEVDRQRRLVNAD